MNCHDRNLKRMAAGLMVPDISDAQYELLWRRAGEKLRHHEDLVRKVLDEQRAPESIQTHGKDYVEQIRACASTMSLSIRYPPLIKHAASMSQKLNYLQRFVSSFGYELTFVIVPQRINFYHARITIWLIYTQLVYLAKNDFILRKHFLATITLDWITCSEYQNDRV